MHFLEICMMVCEIVQVVDRDYAIVLWLILELALE